MSIVKTTTKQPQKSIVAELYTKCLACPRFHISVQVILSN